MPLARATRGLRSRTGSPSTVTVAAVGAVGAEEQAGDLGATGAEQPGQPDAPRRCAARGRAGATPALRPSPSARRNVGARARRRRSPGPRARARRAPPAPADHLRHELEARQLGGEVLADEPAVAQHGDAVADVVHLVEEVGDEQHRDARRPDPLDDLEQLVDLSASRLDVGSSRISTWASTSIARAIDTSCCTASECDSSGDPGSMSRCSCSSTSAARRRIAGQSIAAEAARLPAEHRCSRRPRGWRPG